jgi:hypothetical protein
MSCGAESLRNTTNHGVIEAQKKKTRLGGGL